MEKRVFFYTGGVGGEVSTKRVFFIPFGPKDWAALGFFFLDGGNNFARAPGFLEPMFEGNQE